MRKQSLVVMLLLVLLLTACSGGEPGSEADAVASIVAATLQAQPTSLPLVSETAPMPTGTVNGRVCTPGAAVGDVDVYLQRVNTDDFTIVAISDPESSIVSFTTEAPAGFYIAYAWKAEFRNGGSYSQLVTCGFQASCTDHTLVTFEVLAGQTTEGVDVCDWYAREEVPYPPGVDGPSN